MTKPVCDCGGQRRTCTRRPGSRRPTAKQICPANRLQETLPLGSTPHISPHFHVPQGSPHTRTAHSCCPRLPQCRRSLHWPGICHRGTRKPIVLSCWKIMIFVQWGGKRGTMNCCPKTLNNVDISRKCFKRQSNSPGVSLCKDSFASPLIPLPPPQPYCLVLPACRQNLDQQS